MDSKNAGDMKKHYFYLIVLLIAIVVSFFFGRCNRQTKTVVKYVKGDTITDTIIAPNPTTIEVPKIVYLPTKPIYIDGDTILITDTIEVIKDYSAIKTYDLKVFDDDVNGKLNITQRLQYNSILDFNYNFTPIQKQTTIYKKELFTPFVSANYMTNNSFGMGGGVFIGNLGVEYLLIKSFDENINNNNFHSVGFKIKF